MKKVSKCFVVSELFPIFATAILEKTSGNALFDILHDRQKGVDLIESGKFKVCVSSLQRWHSNLFWFVPYPSSEKN